MTLDKTASYFVVETSPYMFLTDLYNMDTGRRLSEAWKFNLHVGLSIAKDFVEKNGGKVLKVTETIKVEEV
jgi:hypothetical protein